MSELIIQIIGFVGVAFFLASYQLRSNRGLFLFQLLGCIVFTLQFFLLEAYAGALSMIVIILRNLLLLKIDDWKWVKSKVTLSVLIAMLVVITFYTWAGWTSILPFISVSVTTIGYWTNNGQKIRLSQMIGSPCTLVYDALIHSWGGALNESIALISIMVSIIRFGWENLGREATEF